MDIWYSRAFSAVAFGRFRDGMFSAVGPSVSGTFRDNAFGEGLFREGTLCMCIISCLYKRHSG